MLVTKSLVPSKLKVPSDAEIEYQVGETTFTPEVDAIKLEMLLLPAVPSTWNQVKLISVSKLIVVLSSS